ncbi:transposase (fragment) [Nitrosomonas mobilis]|uniref:Mutator family transposase n=1 Tax=Nitrosomonas mobilis TaxID=51642 RepID=A0A1G5SKD4_9PROT
MQFYIVHMVRNSLNYAGLNKRKEVVADLRLIYSAATIDEAEQALADFEDKWNKAYPPISLSWRNNWQRIIPFFDYPPEIRRIIYTTNTIESVNMSLRKVSKIRGSFPNDDAVIKLFYLALSNIVKRWSRPIRDWKPALNRFTIQFNERMPRQY